MRTSIVKTLFPAVCAILFAQTAASKTYQIEKWNISPSDRTETKKNKAFIYALNNASDGDILEIRKDNISVTSDAEVRKQVLVRSIPEQNYTLKNTGGIHIFNIHPGGTLTLSNITVDCESKSRTEDLFRLFPMEITKSGNNSAVTNVARMTIGGGTTIKNVHLETSSDNENAAIHVKTGAVLRIQHGAMIQNCNNESNPGKGGAICCDYGTIIMSGGTITGCRAVGAGGAIHTDGTRVDAVEVNGISARGDIYISGGYITNNICGAGMYGGAIYLGNSGPMLHITGNPVITNNFSGSALGRGTPDDVSTYRLENTYANRLKLVCHSEDNPSGFTTNGITFTGSVGVRYPDPSKDNLLDPQGMRFGGVWEYFTETDDEARNFFWNGGPGYHGRHSGNSLVWANYIVHELPKDGVKIKELIESGEGSPLYIELTSDYEMQTANAVHVPENYRIVLDLQGYNLKCDFHVENETGQVVIRDSSIMKSGTVSGHRESEYPNAFLLEGGSYHTFPPDEWVASNRVLISNYCTEHPYMVASLAWDTTNTAYMADLTKVPLSQSDGEVRMVRSADDVDKITFSTGDWAYDIITNDLPLKAQVFAVAAVSNETGITEFGNRVKIFDTAQPPDGISGNEDEFEWDAQSYGLIKLIHITMEQKGENLVTNNEEYAYFQFPEAAFQATQRKTGGKLSIKVVEELLSSWGYNRVVGFAEDDVNTNLDTKQANGLRKWENIVTGTEENQLLLSTVENGSDGGVSLNVALADAEKVGRGDTGYTVKYDIRKSTERGWERVGEIMDAPRFSVPLLGENGASVGASGFYRITTLIIPEGELSVTNEIPSTNIVGVLEVASKLTNTLAAVPWTALAKDPVESAANLVKVADYVHTPHLEAGDSVQVADKGHIYSYWRWNNGWEGAQTVTREAVLPETAASAYSLERNSAVWVTRNKPDEKPFFLIGQYSSEVQKLKIEAGTDANPVCTLVPNPSLTAVALNDSVWNWGTNPLGNNKDLIRIPNGNKAPLLVQWNGTEWGRHVNEGRKTVWKNDVTIPAGTGFWYMRCGEDEFEITLPASAPVTE